MIIDGDYITTTIEKGTKIVVRRYIRRKGHDDYEEYWQSPLSAIDTEDPEVQECLEQLGWKKVNNNRATGGGEEMESRISRGSCPVLREIPNMPLRTYAGIIQDGRSQCIEILIYRESSDVEPATTSRFNIDWAESKERVDWLTNIIARDLRQAYHYGISDHKGEVRDLASKLFKKLDSSL